MAYLRPNIGTGRAHVSDDSLCRFSVLVSLLRPPQGQVVEPRIALSVEPSLFADCLVDAQGHLQDRCVARGARRLLLHSHVFSVAGQSVDVAPDCRKVLSDGHPSASLVLKQNPGSNASTVIKEVKAKLEELKKDFPPGIDYEINYDVSKFVDASIDKVLHTLVEAFILVAVVVFIFLGDWRSTFIPILAVPVSLIGAFTLMQFFST